MKLTAWGELGGPGTIAATRTRSGSLTSARSYDSVDLELPPEGIEVDVDHDGHRLGEVVRVELGRDDRLRAVAVLDNDRLASVGEDVFFSPVIEMRGRDLDGSTYIGESARLLGLSVTLSTARVGALPIRMRSGDVRSSVDRFRWPISWASSDPLLERAAHTKSLATRIYRTPEFIRVRGGYLVDHELIPVGDRRGYWPSGDERPIGPLRIRPCRIVSVS
jgi:hypothetical protein